MQERNIWTYLGYYGFIYLIFVLMVVIGFPLAKQYAAPVVSMIFPLDQHNSMPKTLLVMTGMYWAMVVGFMLLNPQKKP